MKMSPRAALLVSLLLLLPSLFHAQDVAIKPRISTRVDASRRITLKGNTHPWALAKFDMGAAPDATPAQHMLLVLSRSEEQQQALKKLLDEQQDPESANFRKWLAPSEFGEKFGPAMSDLNTVSAWLASEGFQVERVAAGRNVVQFSGTVDQVRNAFHTDVHRYAVRGKEYFANSSDPQIPDALAPVVKGLVSLNNFPRKPLAHRKGIFVRNPETGAIRPEFTLETTSGNYYAIGAGDFAKIYNTKGLLDAGTNGSGQTIAIIGRTQIRLQDVIDFRNMFGLGPGDNSIVVVGEEPGIYPDDEVEAAIDMQWANAAAPGATVKLVIADGTMTTDGIDLAAQYVVEHNMSSVLSLSYGVCESAIGAAGVQHMSDLWMQAAAQGITVVVATGDNGSAGCDNPFAEYVATSGLGVSALASTPYNVAVGGTDFDYSAGASNYWSTYNDSMQTSVLSYIPEMSWNGSCANTATASNKNVCPTLPTSGTVPDKLNLLSGSGGVSQFFAKPSWQTGAGVPNDGHRDIPDISLFSAIGADADTFYLACVYAQMDNAPCNAVSWRFLGVGGTSVAAPAFGGIVAMAAQKAGTRLGNLNYMLYSLAAQSGSSCTSARSHPAGCIFNDVVKGNISVPCAAGSPNCSVHSGTATGVIVDQNGVPAYPTSTAYDLATGLGSVNGMAFVNAIAAGVSSQKQTATSLTLNGGTDTVTAKHGDPISVAVSVTPNTATGLVSIVANSGGVDSATLASGSVNWTSTLFPGGSYSAQAHYAGDGTNAGSDSNDVAVEISPEDSKTILNIAVPDENYNTVYGATTVEYGSPYILRMDVADTAATFSADGVSSKCSNRTATCPTGNITLLDNGQPLDGGEFNLNTLGFAEDFEIQLSGGTHTISAAYAGDASYGANEDSITVDMTPAKTALTLGLSDQQPIMEYGRTLGMSGALTSTSTGVAPSGSVIFTDNGSDPGSSISGRLYGSAAAAPNYARATYTGSLLLSSVGTHTLVPHYSGDTNYAEAYASPFTIEVDRATTSFWPIGVSPWKTTPNIPVKITASPQAYPRIEPLTGSVTFFDNGKQLGDPIAISTDQQSITVTFTEIGTHEITASYSGDSHYKAVTGIPGTVTVYDKVPTQMSTSVRTYPQTWLRNYPVQLSVEASSPDYGLPTPTGTITYLDNGTPIGSTQPASNSGGTTFFSTLTHAFPDSGTHNITATYSGDAVFAQSSTKDPLSLTILDKLPTSVSYLNPTLLYTDRVSHLTTEVRANGAAGPKMTGTVTFLDGTTEIGSTSSFASVSSLLTASVDHTFTTPGIHNLSVQYSGDENYEASTRSFQTEVYGPVGIQVYEPDMTLPKTGGTISKNIYVFNSTSNTVSVTLSCKPDSAFATCTFDQPTLSIGPNGGNNVYLIITVPATAASLHPSGPWTLAGLSAVVMFGMCCVGRRRGTKLLTIAVVVMALGAVSCGGGGEASNYPGGGGTPPPVTGPSAYNFTITAMSGTIIDTRTLTLHLQ